SLAAGDNIALDSASSGVANGDVTARAITGDLTVIQQSLLLAQSGKMDLDAGNRASITDSTLSAATDLAVDALDADIDLDNATATAGNNLAMTAGTDVSLDHSTANAIGGDMDLTGTSGDVTLNQSNASSGGNLTGTAGQNLAFTDSNAT
ncbi:hypothetical protein HAL1_20305, partial [Halomonas sp. HAL1]|uniref:hypothetical protein n=1 Tax=Halomonas sp. HAL1 TaxID=550984 RepID=UPI00022D3030